MHHTMQDESHPGCKNLHPYLGCHDVLQLAARLFIWKPWECQEALGIHRAGSDGAPDGPQATAEPEQAGAEPKSDCMESHAVQGGTPYKTRS